MRSSTCDVPLLLSGCFSVAFPELLSILSQFLRHSCSRDIARLTMRVSIPSHLLLHTTLPTLKLVRSSFAPADSKALASAAADRLVASGGTALFAGLEEGIKRLAAAPPSHTAIDALFMCTDGQANVSVMLSVQCIEWLVVNANSCAASLPPLALRSVASLLHPLPACFPSQTLAYLDIVFL